MRRDAIISVGMISLSAGILIGQFTAFEVGGFSISAFTEGLLMGLALVMNLYCLATLWRE